MPYFAEAPLSPLADAACRFPPPAFDIADEH
jgi:hypothetical protein